MGLLNRERVTTKQGGAFYVLIVILGFILPPLAVVVRFGIGRDFFINIILTCMGYIPGHAHNFYLQNIRNNRGRGRTPKWAIKHGLVAKPDDSKHAWAKRYNEHEAVNQYDVPDSSDDEDIGDFLDEPTTSRQPRRANADDSLKDMRKQRNAVGAADPLDDAQSIEFPESQPTAVQYAPQGRTFAGDDLPGMGDRHARSQKGISHHAREFVKPGSSKTAPTRVGGPTRPLNGPADDLDDFDRELQGVRKPRARKQQPEPAFDDLLDGDDFDRELQGRPSKPRQPHPAPARPAIAQPSKSAPAKPSKPKDNFEDFWNHEF